MEKKALAKLANDIKQWGKALGFQQVGITDVDLSAHEPQLQAWLDKGYHGDMEYMARYGMMRARPAELLPGTVRAISVRMDYLPSAAHFATDLANPQVGYISRYAVGRDYHKVLRKRLKQLGDKISARCAELATDFNFRPFVDSAPVMERPLADKAGLGWTGKHTLLLNAEAGSFFFLGELLINLPLPIDEPQPEKCGKCVACIKICPTNAIVEPYVLDARKCISYLTIENDGPIPEQYRAAIGNRIYGCDDCQLICPWNRYSQLATEDDFQFRDAWQDRDLLTLFNWDEATFLRNTQGSAIRRIGFRRWQRNISVAIGNAPYQEAYVTALNERLADCEDEMLQEHFEWALSRQQQQLAAMPSRGQQRLIRAIKIGMPRDAD